MRDLIRKAMDEVNESLPESQRVQRFMLLYKELDADDGELTRNPQGAPVALLPRSMPILSMLFMATAIR